MELPILGHPTDEENSLTAEFADEADCKPDSEHPGEYFLANLDPKDPVHCAQVQRLLEKKRIDYSRMPGWEKQIAEFDPVFQTKEVAASLEKLIKASERLPLLEAERAKKEEEHARLKAVRVFNDPEKVEALVMERDQARHAEEVAMLTVEAAKGQIADLNEQLQTAIQRERSARFKECAARVDPAIEEFNKGVETLFETFWKKVGKEFLEMARLKADFPPLIYFEASGIHPKLLELTKRLKAFPQIQKKGDTYCTGFKVSTAAEFAGARPPRPVKPTMPQVRFEDQSEFRCGIAWRLSPYGRREDVRDWRAVDQLEVLFPELVTKVQRIERDILADPILIEMQSRLPDDNRKAYLTRYLDALRQTEYATVGQKQDESERLQRQAAVTLGRNLR